jgi:hypothetical protein
MYQRLCVLIVATVVCVGASVGRGQSPATDGARLVNEAQRAIGAAAAMRGLRTLVLRGHTRVLNGATNRLSAPRPTEIRILLPDHYLKTCEAPAERYRNGFSSGRLLNAIVPTKPGVEFAAEFGPEDLILERIQFTRLTLGMLARISGVLDLAVQAKRADTFEAKATGFQAQVDLDPVTRVPLRVRWDGDVHFPEPGSAFPSKPIRAEVVLSFEDRRVVAGLKLPYRIRRLSRDIVFEELLIDAIQVNPPLTAAQFVQ